MSTRFCTVLRRALGGAVLVLGLGPAVAHAQSGPARLVLDIDGPGSSSNPRLITPFGSKVAFVVDRPFQTELWTSDGTSFNTRPFFSYPPGQAVTELKAFSDALYFIVNQGFNGYRLSRSTGELSFPQEIFSTSGFDPLPITQLTAAGPFLYFVTKEEFGEFTLWQTNGTDNVSAPDPTPVMRFAEEPRLLADLNGRLLLSGRTFFDTAPLLWTSDGTSQGTVRIPMFFGGPPAAVGSVTVLGDRAFFAASDAQQGRELWSTTTEFVAPLPFEVRPGPASSDPQELTVVQGQIFFTADDGIHGRELWTLGEFGFEMVTDIVPGPQDAAPQSLRAAENRLYYTADDGVFGRELWVTEARPVPFGQERTRRVTDESFGPGSSAPQALKNVDGTLFFGAVGGIPPFPTEELYTTGGTEQSTFRFELNPFFQQSSRPADFTVAGGRVFFTADDGTSGRELWTVDNLPPTVQVPPDQTVDVGDFPNLSAFAQDPDFSPNHTYEWRDADGALLSREAFAIPQIGAPGVYEFTAVARDWAGGRGENRVHVVTPGRTAPVVSIVSPAAGDVLHAGANYDVQWTASDPEAIAGARVLLSTDNGTFYAPITGCEVQGTVSTCRWTPQSEVEKLRLRVEVTDEMGDRGFGYAEVRVTGPLTEPQRLDLTLVGVDGAAGFVRAGDFDFCSLDPGQPSVTCTFFYPPGSVQPLEAFADPISVFEAWSGTCTGNGTCSVPMNGPRQVTATFVPRRVVLTVVVQSVAQGNGYIGVVGPPNTPPGFCEAIVDGTQTCTFPYVPGAQVFLGATTAPGSRFVGYSAPCGPQPECFLSLDQDMEITAAFGGATQLAITVASVDGGVGAILGTTSDGQFLMCPPGPGDPPQTCTFDVPAGVSVQLEALAEGETGFTGWSGPCTGTDPFCSFTVVGNTAVTGTFQGGVRKPLNVITASSDNARGRVSLSDGNFCAVFPSNVPNTSSCTIFYNPGTVITMIAQPDPGTVFLGWSGACTGTGACTVTMDQAREVTGTFRGPSRRLTLQVGSVGGGRGGVRNSFNNALCQTTGSPVVCVVTIPQVGTVVTLTAVPQPGSRLLGWSGACSGTGACQVTMSDAVTVGATFGPPNRPPVANAGGPYTGVGNAPVTFDGSGSSDPDGDAVTYAWDFGDGSTGTGVAPSHAYGTTGTFTVTLVVSDGQESSAPATAAVTIANRPPVANAGGPYAGVRNVPITFDGSGSSDPDGDALTYAWDFGDGSTGTGVAPSHAYGTTGTFTMTLVVSDGQESSATATATVTIVNAPPQANAGPDQTVRRLTVVVLDGRSSSDSDGTLTAYAWRQVSGPSVVLVGHNTTRAAFLAPFVHSNPVVLEFELKVTDNDGATSTDRVRVTVTR